jgi:hypothetical protein
MDGEKIEFDGSIKFGRQLLKKTSRDRDNINLFLKIVEKHFPTTEIMFEGYANIPIKFTQVMDSKHIEFLYYPEIHIYAYNDSLKYQKISFELKHMPNKYNTTYNKNRFYNSMFMNHLNIPIEDNFTIEGNLTNYKFKPIENLFLEEKILIGDNLSYSCNFDKYNKKNLPIISYNLSKYKNCKNSEVKFVNNSLKGKYKKLINEIADELYDLNIVYEKWIDKYNSKYKKIFTKKNIHNKNWYNFFSILKKVK